MLSSKTKVEQGVRQPHRGALPIVVPGMLIALFLPLLMVSTSFWSSFDGKLYDQFLTRQSSSPSSRIVIVDIDEQSLSKHGQWPWPRYKIAAIMDRLAQYGAAAIGLDMVFAEKDRTSPSTIKSDLKKELNIDISFNVGGEYLDNDLLFSQALSTGPSVLGYQFLFETNSAAAPCRLHPLRLLNRSGSADPGRFALQPVQASCNLNLFADQVTHSGFFNVAPDTDGILRRVPLVMASGGHFYPCLALATVMKALQLEQVGLVPRNNEFVLTVGRNMVPLDRYGRLGVNFRGSGKTYTYLSAGDILEGKLSAHLFRNKIVFLGSSAAGLKEYRSTPTDPLFPGVEVHATIADNLLAADFIHMPADGRAIELMAAVFCGIVFVVTTIRARALTGILLVCLGIVGSLYFSFQLFTKQSLFISPLPAVLVLLAEFVVLNLVQFRREELKNMHRTRELAQAQAAIIEGMAALTETRDPETGGHIKRTQTYVRLLALAARDIPAYRAQLGDEIVELLYRSAPLHDIGKVGVSDKILLKPGPLTTAEFEEMKKHTTIGKEVVLSIAHTLGDTSFLQTALEIVYTHHEKWDGSGYPQGLKATAIPLSGRLMAIADVYDALTSRRVYREALPHEEAVQIMRRQAASSFDPHLFAKFIEHSEAFRAIADGGAATASELGREGKSGALSTPTIYAHHA